MMQTWDSSDFPRKSDFVSSEFVVTEVKTNLLRFKTLFWVWEGEGSVRNYQNLLVNLL